MFKKLRESIKRRIAGELVEATLEEEREALRRAEEEALKAIVALEEEQKNKAEALAIAKSEAARIADDLLKEAREKKAVEDEVVRRAVLRAHYSQHDIQQEFIQLNYLDPADRRFIPSHKLMREEDLEWLL